tara:strand:+ start:95 stop:577 length:483 start_codon:yes stop_codon:yes gene_type:complete
MKKFNIKKWQDKHLSEQCGGMEVKHYDSPEGEGKMAKGDAIELANDAADVASMIGPETNLPEWVESKITLAADYLNTVKDYLSNYDASRLHEQDDTFFKDVFGDDELKDSSSKSRDLINKLRQDYRNMSDEELDKFSIEMIEHFLDNVAAKERAKMLLNK